jgi:hypothetical protein
MSSRTSSTTKSLGSQAGERASSISPAATFIEMRPVEKRSTYNNGRALSTFQGDLAKLPPALAPLIQRPQWAVWRWTQNLDGHWQKPPFQAHHPQQHASTNNPATWTDYETALATVKAGEAQGISYILTEQDPFAALDLDHCRDLKTSSLAEWAQQLLSFRAHTSRFRRADAACASGAWLTASGCTGPFLFGAARTRSSRYSAEPESPSRHRAADRHLQRGARQHRSADRAGGDLGRAA